MEYRGTSWGEKGVKDWSVYLLRCADGTLYCGTSTDVARRVAMHNGFLAGGARYTRGRRPVSLLASAGGMTRQEALRFERLIKRLPRTRKLDALLHRSVSVLPKK